jgi:hypothetical protein
LSIIYTKETEVAETCTSQGPLLAYSQKIRPGRCPDPEIIALRMLMINQAQEAGGLWEIPGILNNICADRELSLPNTPEPGFGSCESAASRRS